MVDTIPVPEQETNIIFVVGVCIQPKFGAGIMALTIFLSTIASVADPLGVTAFVQNHELDVTVLSDLDGDGRPNALIYALTIVDDC